MTASESGFRYHPDPVATGSAEGLTSPCVLCGRTSGLAYKGPVYGRRPDGPLCLECIRDGSASTRLSGAGARAEFTDVGGPECTGIPLRVLDEVACRTPGFSGWQQEHWLYHCGDAAAYLGRVGASEVERLPDARQALLDEAIGYGVAKEDAEAHLAELHPDGNAAAYLFRCLHCGTHSAYLDLS